MIFSLIDQLDDKYQAWHQSWLDEIYVRYGITITHVLIACIWCDEPGNLLNAYAEGKPGLSPIWVMIDCALTAIFITTKRPDNAWLMMSRKAPFMTGFKYFTAYFFFTGIALAISDETYWVLSIIGIYGSLPTFIYVYFSTFDPELKKKRDEYLMHKYAKMQEL